MPYYRKIMVSPLLIQAIITPIRSSTSLLSTPFYSTTAHLSSQINTRNPSVRRYSSVWGSGSSSQRERNTSIHSTASFSPFGTNTSNAMSSDSSQNRTPPTTTPNTLVVCCPSGVGKGTIISQFMSQPQYASLFGFSVSHTTRSPRPGEVNGTHYHFTTHDSMTRSIANGDFLEHAHVHGNLYGTSFESVRGVIAGGKHCLLDIDVEGVKTLKGGGSSRTDVGCLSVAYLFVAPPSLEVLEERLRGRGTESEESVRRRLGNALCELEYGMQEGHFDHVVVNDDIDRATKEFEEFVRGLFQIGA